MKRHTYQFTITEWVFRALLKEPSGNDYPWVRTTVFANKQNKMIPNWHHADKHNFLTFCYKKFKFEKGKPGV